ncbi:MAG: hypothetical protein MUF23_13675, partial [Pirellula sp.]|nr:hypothetical protein [Pirellula sp.]
MSNDANLLFAMLAIQLDLIKADQLIQAANQWMINKQVPIADILVSQGHLSQEDREFVDLVFKKLTSRTGSVEKSIDSLSHSSLTSFDSERGGRLPSDLSDLAEGLSQRTCQADPTTQAFQLREGRAISDQFRIVRGLA